MWAGTGEPNSRNTIEPGAGVYKSTDGGNTWTLMGLEKTQHIGRIAVDPRNKNVVYVAALGAAWKPNAERGLYKTTDGGKTWTMIKFISDRAGFVDVADRPAQSRRHLRVELGALSHAVLAQQRRPGQRPLEVHRRRQDVDGDQGQRLPRGHEGTHRSRDRAEQPDVVYALTEALSLAPTKGGYTMGKRPAGERPLSLDRRRQDVGAHEHHRRAAVLLLAGARRPEEPRSRVLLVHRAAGLERRRQDDEQRRAGRARRRPRHLDRPE